MSCASAVPSSHNPHLLWAGRGGPASFKLPASVVEPRRIGSASIARTPNSRSIAGRDRKKAEPQRLCPRVLPPESSHHHPSPPPPSRPPIPHSPEIIDGGWRLTDGGGWLTDTGRLMTDCGARRLALCGLEASGSLYFPFPGPKHIPLLWATSEK